MPRFSSFFIFFLWAAICSGPVLAQTSSASAIQAKRSDDQKAQTILSLIRAGNYAELEKYGFKEKDLESLAASQAQYQATQRSFAIAQCQQRLMTSRQSGNDEVSAEDLSKSLANSPGFAKWLSRAVAIAGPRLNSGASQARSLFPGTDAKSQHRRLAYQALFALHEISDLPSAAPYAQDPAVAESETIERSVASDLIVRALAWHDNIDLSSCDQIGTHRR